MSTTAPASRKHQMYLVTVEGYGAEIFLARSRGKALADAANSPAFSGMPFKRFLQIANARKALIGPFPDFYEALRKSYPDSVIPAEGTRITAEGRTGHVLTAITPTSCVSFECEETGNQINVHPMSVALADRSRTEGGQ